MLQIYCYNKCSTCRKAMQWLEERGIETRPGLHCAPAAHRFLGSFPDGAVRVSAGPWTTARELETLLGALS